MSHQDFWKTHYAVATNPKEIAAAILVDSFVSSGESYDLPYFRHADAAHNILISQGTGGHALVFAELAYCLHRKGFNVFIMPKHGGHAISRLMVRHEAALNHIAENFNGPIGIFGEGLGGFVTFYLALARAPFRSGKFTKIRPAS